MNVQDLAHHILNSRGEQSPEAIELAKHTLAQDLDPGGSQMAIEVEKITRLIQSHARYLLLRSIFIRAHGPTVLMPAPDGGVIIEKPKTVGAVADPAALLDAQLDYELQRQQEEIHV